MDLSVDADVHKVAGRLDGVWLAQDEGIWLRTISEALNDVGIDMTDDALARISRHMGPMVDQFVIRSDRKMPEPKTEEKLASAAILVL